MEFISNQMAVPSLEQAWNPYSLDPHCGSRVYLGKGKSGLQGTHFCKCWQYHGFFSNGNGLNGGGEKTLESKPVCPSYLVSSTWVVI